MYESFENTGSTSDTPESDSNESQEKVQHSFLDFLPIELLKRVHERLKSQPPTLVGKIKFLKTFERTLLDEIGKFINY